MKRIPLILTTSLLLSCSPRLYPTQTIKQEKTVVEKEIIRDTIIQIQQDSTIIEALVRCDSTGRARLQEIRTLKESQRVQQSISIDQEPQPYQPTPLTIKTEIDSMGIYLQYKERFSEEVKTEIREVIIEKKENILKGYQKFLMSVGATSILIMILILLKKVLH